MAAEVKLGGSEGGSVRESRRKHREERQSSFKLLYDSAIIRALIHIERHLHEETDPKALARLAGLSLVHFRSRFRRALGEPLASHIRRLRLERAAAFLTFSRQPVLDLALACGFDSHEGFTRAFARTFGRSPFAYREGRNGEAEDYRRRAADLPVRLVERPALRVAFIRYMGAPLGAGAAWPTMLRFARDEGWAQADGRMVGIHHENPKVLLNPNCMRYDAGITVGPDFNGNEHVAVQEIPGGTDAVVTFRGMLPDLEDFWHRFVIGWMMPSPYAWRDDRFFDVMDTPPEPWLFPEAAEEAAKGELSIELHIPVARGRLSVEPVSTE